MSTIRVNALQDTNGVERYTARAWVNFNGTGTVAIRGSGNVSSITDNGTGNYTVNFSSAMPDANYSAVGATGRTANTYDMPTFRTYATTSVVTLTGTDGGVAVDPDFVNIAVFR